MDKIIEGLLHIKNVVDAGLIVTKEDSKQYISDPLNELIHEVRYYKENYSFVRFKEAKYIPKIVSEEGDCPNCGSEDTYPCKEGRICGDCEKTYKI